MANDSFMFDGYRFKLFADCQSLLAAANMEPTEEMMQEISCEANRLAAESAYDPKDLVQTFTYRQCAWVAAKKVVWKHCLRTWASNWNLLDWAESQEEPDKSIDLAYKRFGQWTAAVAGQPVLLH